MHNNENGFRFFFFFFLRFHSSLRSLFMSMLMRTFAQIDSNKDEDDHVCVNTTQQKTPEFSMMNGTNVIATSACGIFLVIITVICEFVHVGKYINYSWISERCSYDATGVTLCGWLNQTIRSCLKVFWGLGLKGYDLCMFERVAMRSGPFKRMSLWAVDNATDCCLLKANQTTKTHFESTKQHKLNGNIVRWDENDKHIFMFSFNFAWNLFAWQMTMVSRWVSDECRWSMLGFRCERFFSVESRRHWPYN